MKHIILICDSERGFGRRLADYINHKDEFPYDALFVDNVSELGNLTNMSVDVCLCDTPLRSSCEQELKDVGIFELYTDIPVEEGAFKYQKADLIIRDLIRSRGLSAKGNRSIRHRSMKVIGIWTPEEGYGQTELGLGLGLQLSKVKKTLYMNLQPYAIQPGINFASDGGDMRMSQTDLSDLYFAASTNPESIAVQLGGMITTIDRLHILPTMKSMRDLMTITTEGWFRLLQQIENETDYDYLILDMSDIIDGYLDILQRLDVVLSPVCSEEGRIRQRLFIDDLQALGLESLEKSIIYIDISKAIRKAGYNSFGAEGRISLELERLTEGLIEELGEKL